MSNGKILTDFANLLSPNEFEMQDSLFAKLNIKLVKRMKHIFIVLNNFLLN